MRRIVRYAHPIVLRGDTERLLFRGAAGAGEHVNVPTNVADADVAGPHRLPPPRTRHRRQLDWRARRNRGALDRAHAGSELFTGRGEWRRITTLPGAVLRTERRAS